MNRDNLLKRWQQVRSASVAICSPLEIEDHVVQTMDDVSPPKWHLGHVTWFFETFILARYIDGYQPVDPGYAFVFNSYYAQAGARFDRPRRGVLSRPTVAAVYDYRRVMDEQMADLIGSIDDAQLPELAGLLELGLNHEQQHQELMVADIKHILACNPLGPAYHAPPPNDAAADTTPSRPVFFRGGEVFTGAGTDIFAYDNERPRHAGLLHDFGLHDRLVTAGEYRAFIEDGGYAREPLWLSDGWAWVQREQIDAPLYWEPIDGAWHVTTLAGRRPIDPHEPVCHTSYYEAEAFARWAGKRLPTEFEWEHAARTLALDPDDAGWNYLDEARLHPRPARALHAAAPMVATPAGSDSAVSLPAIGDPPVDATAATDGPFTALDSPVRQLFGDVWEWTGSAYLPYPGFQPLPGALGEYNGKFMSGQMVLRGGCCVTPRGHIRASYRNFLHPDKRWLVTGIRLAEDG